MTSSTATEPLPYANHGTDVESRLQALEKDARRWRRIGIAFIIANIISVAAVAFLSWFFIWHMH